MVAGWSFLWALFAPPEPARLERPSATPERARIETRRGRGEMEPILPQPPEGTEQGEADEVQVTVHPDGRAEARVPRATRGAFGLCLASRCVQTRGAKTPAEPMRPMPDATAPTLGGLVFTFGYQPVSTNAAAAMLRATSDARAERARDWQERALERSSREIGRRLAAIVRDRSLTNDEKRRVIFELWDDATATAADRIADEDRLAQARVRTARSIADAIERFVQRAMPRGSELGYSPHELAALNQHRQSPEPFAPYDPTLD